MPEFVFTGSQIERLTGGHITLKTISNWTNSRYWYSELQPHRRGYPRKFSRLNVLESVVASELMLLGIKRPVIKELFEYIAKTEGVGRDNFETLEPYSVSSSRDDFYMVLSLEDLNGERSIGLFMTVRTPVMQLHAAQSPRTLAIVPLSKILRRIDDAETMEGDSE